jgi:CRISPR/Cas system-associated exonuclease Cas4 (RecB family)
MKIHQSEAKCWNRCKQQYHYRYDQKIQRKKRPRPLIRGTVIHEMIEEHIEGRDPWKPWRAMKKKYSKLFKEEQEEYGDLPKQLELLMSSYFEWYKQDPLKPIKINGRRSEHAFSVPLMDGIKLEGIIDTIGKSKDGVRWLVDHKTHKQIPEGDIVYSDIQTAVYLWACWKSKIKIDGIAWNYIKAKTPVIPEVLKSGKGLSKRQNMDTTWRIYKQAILDNGFKVKDYKDMKEILEGNEVKFFRRIYIPADEVLVDNILENFRRIAVEIRDRGPKSITRNIEKHCSWCEYKSLCQAELKGKDVKRVRRMEYEKAEKRPKRKRLPVDYEED